jgi:hypothetical protein
LAKSAGGAPFIAKVFAFPVRETPAVALAFRLHVRFANAGDRVVAAFPHAIN